MLRLLLPVALLAAALSSRPALGQDTAAPGLAALPLDSLLARMNAQDHALARPAFEEAVRRGEAATMAQRLRHADGPVRAAAMHVLVEMGERALPLVMEALRRDDARNLLFPLRYATEGNPRRLPIAAALLEEADPALRAAGAEMLERPWYAEKDTIRSPEAERLMLAALKDRDADVRAAAAGALSRPSYVTPSEVQALIDLLRADPSPEVRSEVALALGELGAAAAPAVPHLAAALASDGDAAVRSRSAQALGELGPSAASAVPELIRATASTEGEVRGEAIGALGEIGIAPPVDADAVLRALRDALAHRDLSTRRGVVHAAALLARPAHPLLLDALRDSAGEVAASAANVLADAPATPLVVDALFAALADPREPVRHAAADALVSLGPEQMQRLRETAEGGAEAARDAALRAVHLLREATRLPLTGACYAIRRGPWTPRMELDLDSIYSTPPQQVRFTTRVRRGRGGPSFDVARADPGERGWTLGTWKPVTDRDGVSIDFSNGFSGVYMNLELSSDGSLQGTAETYWDFPRERQRAEITAERIPCPSDA